MKQIYRLQEEESLNMHGQLWIGGKYYRIDTGQLEQVELILRHSNNLDLEDIEERDKKDELDRKLKQRTVV